MLRGDKRSYGDGGKISAAVMQPNIGAMTWKIQI